MTGENSILRETMNLNRDITEQSNLFYLRTDLKSARKPASSIYMNSIGDWTITPNLQGEATNTVCLRKYTQLSILEWTRKT